MRKLVLILLLSSVLVLFFVLVKGELFQSDSDPVEDRPVENDISSPSKPDATPEPEENEHDVVPLSEYSDQITRKESELRPAGWSDKRWVEFVFTHREETKENGSVEFYGKIVDERGNPIAGVDLVATVFYNEPSMRSVLETNSNHRETTVNIKTTADGSFSVVEPIGITLTLQEFRKSGFMLSGKKSYIFDFGTKMRSVHKADPTDPVIFRMGQSP